MAVATPNWTVVTGDSAVSANYLGAVIISDTNSVADVVAIKDTDASGTAVLTLNAPADTTEGVSFNGDPLYFPGGIYVDVTGTMTVTIKHE